MTIPANGRCYRDPDGCTTARDKNMRLRELLLQNIGEEIGSVARREPLPGWCLFPSTGDTNQSVAAVTGETAPPEEGEG